MVVFACPLECSYFLSNFLETSAVRMREMPLPRFVHSPGFTIHIFLSFSCFCWIMNAL